MTASPRVPPQSGQQPAITGTFTGSTDSANSASVRNRKKPWPGFRPGGFGFGLIEQDGSRRFHLGHVSRQVDHFQFEEELSADVAGEGPAVDAIVPAQLTGLFASAIFMVMGSLAPQIVKNHGHTVSQHAAPLATGPT